MVWILMMVVGDSLEIMGVYDSRLNARLAEVKVQDHYSYCDKAVGTFIIEREVYTDASTILEDISA